MVTFRHAVAPVHIQETPATPRCTASCAAVKSTVNVVQWLKSNRFAAMTREAAGGGASP